MKHVDRIIGALATLGVVLSAIAIIASMFLIAYSVFMRYFLNQPVSWVDELVGYLLVASVMLAAADALRQGEHISVDILTERLCLSGRRITELAGFVTVALAAALLTFEGYDMVEFSHMVGLLSNGSLAVPMWIPQIVVPIGAGLMGIAAIVGFIQLARGKTPVVRQHGHGPAKGVE